MKFLIGIVLFCSVAYSESIVLNQVDVRFHGEWVELKATLYLNDEVIPLEIKKPSVRYDRLYYQPNQKYSEIYLMKAKALTEYCKPRHRTKRTLEMGSYSRSAPIQDGMPTWVRALTLHYTNAKGETRDIWLPCGEKL